MLKHSLLILLFLTSCTFCVETHTDISVQLCALLKPRSQSATNNNIISQKDPYKNVFQEGDLDRFDIQKLGVKYINQIEYGIEKNKIPVIKKIQLSIPDRKILEKYYHLIQEGYESPWVMRYINDEIGYGIFAAEDIQLGDLISEYTGIIYDEQGIVSMNPVDLTYTWTINAPAYFADPLKVKFCIDAKKAGNFTRYINHSYDPNVQAVPLYEQDGWHMLYVACKPIQKGEQMLVDYGAGYWTQKAPQDLSNN